MEWLYKYLTNNLEDKVAIPFKAHKRFNFHDRHNIT